MLSTITEKLFDTGEVTINYAEGPQGGPPAVLLHGIQGRWQGVQRLIPMLDKQWHVYALDLRGHARSGHTPARYNLLDYARDVGTFATHLSEPAVLIGHSLGALIALVTAAEYPSSTRAVVLLDPPVDFDFVAQHWSEAFAYFRFLRDFLGGSPSLEAIAAEEQAREPEMDRAWAEARADQLSRVDPDALDALVEGYTYEGFSVEEHLRQVRCPLLLLYGDWDKGAVVRDEDAAFVRAHLPSATIAKVPGGSHMFFEEQPDLVRQHLDAFLTSV